MICSSGSGMRRSDQGRSRIRKAGSSEWGGRETAVPISGVHGQSSCSGSGAQFPQKLVTFCKLHYNAVLYSLKERKTILCQLSSDGNSREARGSSSEPNEPLLDPPMQGRRPVITGWMYERSLGGALWRSELF